MSGVPPGCWWVSPIIWTVPRRSSPEPVAPSPESLARRFHLPVEFVDERLTSVAAQSDLRDARRSGARTRRVKREDIDANAARLILETWLGGHAT